MTPAGTPPLAQVADSAMGPEMKNLMVPVNVEVPLTVSVATSFAPTPVVPVPRLSPPLGTSVVPSPAFGCVSRLAEQLSNFARMKAFCSAPTCADARLVARKLAKQPSRPRAERLAPPSMNAPAYNVFAEAPLGLAWNGQGGGTERLLTAAQACAVEGERLQSPKLPRHCSVPP